jgi:hypothetical protein
MIEPVSITEELRARIEELTRECDDRRRRCAMLARAHGALADAGCIVPTEMDETIEHAIKALAKERDAANAKHETLSALVEGYRRERDDLRAEITKAQESFDDDGPSGWMPGETAIDALIRTRDEARAEADGWRVKAEAYGGMVHGCGPALEAAGHPIDPFQPDGRVGGIARSVAALVKERDEARAEVERLAAMLPVHPSSLTDACTSAFERGAEAMREACIEETRSAFDVFVALRNIRALPIPEDKP